MPICRPLLAPFALAGLLACLSAMPAAADADHYRAYYDASLWGLVLGRADLASSIGDDGFNISGTFASVGVARIFDRTNGKMHVTGAMDKRGARPANYDLKYTSGKERKSTSIAFSGGWVTKTENVPPPKKRGDDWVPVSDGDLKGVADPVSALMIPESDPAKVCDRTLKIYDGEMRVDLVLKPAGKNDSFDSGQVTCRVGFVPVSGYRKTRSAIKFLRDRAEIFIAFAPIGETGFVSPVEATIGTEIGTVHIRARPVEVE